MKYLGYTYAGIALASFLVLWAINGFTLTDWGALVFIVMLAACWPLTIWFMVAITRGNRNNRKW